MRKLQLDKHYLITIYHAVFESHLYHISLYRKPNKNQIKSFYFSKRKFRKAYVLTLTKL